MAAPAGTTGRVLELDARPGGIFRTELTYLDDTPGRSSEHRDVTESTFAELEPDVRVVQRVHLQSDDPAFAGPMTWSLRDHRDGTLIEIRADDVPHGISAADHATGLAPSLDNLARHVTGASKQPLYEGTGASRPRICDLGYLREVSRWPDGKLGYRCAAEPVEDHVRKGAPPPTRSGGSAWATG